VRGVVGVVVLVVHARILERVAFSYRRRDSRSCRCRPRCRSSPSPSPSRSRSRSRSRSLFSPPPAPLALPSPAPSAPSSRRGQNKAPSSIDIVPSPPKETRESPSRAGCTGTKLTCPCSLARGQETWKRERIMTHLYKTISLLVLAGAACCAAVGCMAQSGEDEATDVAEQAQCAGIGIGDIGAEKSPMPAQGLSKGFSKDQGFSKTPAEGLSKVPEQGFSKTPEQGFSKTPAEGLSKGPEQGFSKTPEQAFSKM